MGAKRARARGLPGRGQEAWFDDAASAADLGGRRIFAASPLLDADAKPVGVCVFASGDDDATWPLATFLARADHPWLAMAPDGSAALAHLALRDGLATPTLALLEPASLATRSSVALGPAYDADTDDDRLPEYGDYDAIAASGARFLWALTQPNQEGRNAPEGWNDLDVHAYRGAFAAG